MWEENQNMLQWMQQTTLRQETEAFNRRKELMKLRVNNDFSLRRSKENEALYEKSLTTTNENLCWQYWRASKACELARWARKYGESKWYDWSNIEDWDLLNQYSALYPEAWRIMYDYLTQKDEDDPMPYYIKLWWEQPNEEDEAMSWLDNFLWSFKKTGIWINRMINAANMYDWSGQINAFSTYVYDKYWYNPSEEDWKNAERDWRLDPTLEEKYTSFGGWAKDLALWWTISALNANPVWLVGNITATWLATTKPWEAVLWAMWQWAETVGYYANKLPALKQYRDSLPTEEDKREWDIFVWWEILALITRWAIKNYKDIKTYVNGWGSNWGWAWEMWSRWQQRRRMKNQWELEQIGGKIAWAKTVKEQETATRALQDTDVKWSNNYESLSERLKKRWEEIELQEDVEYAKDERKWMPEETRSIKDFEKDWYKSSVLLKPVEEGIALLKDFYEGSPEKMAQLDLIEQKFYNEGLTKWEINKISRAIAEEYDTYKRRWEPKTTVAAKDVEWIRKAVKDFAREGNEELVMLDKKWSDNMNTRAMIKDIQDSIVKFNMNKRSKNALQKLAWVAADIFSFFWGREFLGKIFKNAVWEDSYTPVLRQSDLKKLTNKFSKLNEKLNWAKNKAEAEKIVEDFNNEMNEEFWPIEGEVIEKATSEGYKDNNSYLEDKIEVKED